MLNTDDTPTASAEIAKDTSKRRQAPDDVRKDTNPKFELNQWKEKVCIPNKKNDNVAQFGHINLLIAKT